MWAKREMKIENVFIKIIFGICNRFYFVEFFPLSKEYIIRQAVCIYI